jgi:hypothetical protein
MGCNELGRIVTNVNAGDWDDPYACTYCDAKRLPNHLRYYTKRDEYHEGAEHWYWFQRAGLFKRLRIAIRRQS